MATMQTFSCPDCSEAFPSFSQLKGHIYHAHGRTVSKAILYGAARPEEETEWLTCDHCGESFLGQRKFAAHLRELRRSGEASKEAEERYEHRERDLLRAQAEADQKMARKAVKGADRPMPVESRATVPKREMSVEAKVTNVVVLGLMGVGLYHLFNRAGSRGK